MSQFILSADDSVPVSLPQLVTTTVIVEPAYTYTIPSDAGAGVTLLICRHGGEGGGNTVRLIVTDCCVVPPLFVSVNVIVSLYVLALKLAIEALMVTLCDVPPLRVLLAGLMPSQLEPLAVDADHEPSAPQFVSVIVCGVGSPCPCVALNESFPGLTCRQGGDGGCTASVTATVACFVPVLVVIVKVMVSL